MADVKISGSAPVAPRQLEAATPDSPSTQPAQASLVSDFKRYVPPAIKLVLQANPVGSALRGVGVVLGALHDAVFTPAHGEPLGSTEVGQGK
jgi:hypothetical protein